ncbi:hypothetical protein GCM10007092_02930 [Thermus composti]|uniref:DUF4384 domain-containing protein n=1 Tax=Thermus composti TaxID=532059 RepID=A0ABV6PYE9_9DEIN|nr:DUF4384 domain-containing protein [Thermus composti]GGM93148.1 hypothetical protein GCM10007092_02930 [Thermus composti]
MRFLGVLLLGLLSACSLVVEGGSLTYRVAYGGAILRFEPDRGAGATYFVGEEVRFFLTLDQGGWITLVVVDPDGYTYELDRFYLPRGTHVLPPGPYRYTLTPPRGLHRVRAIYTDSAPGSVRIQGVYTSWDDRLRLYLEASRARRHHVAETYFYVR